MISYFEGVKLPQGCPAEARLCAIGGPKCRFWRPGRQHFGAYVSTHIAIFAQNCSGKLTRSILGPKRCSNVMHSDVSCFSQLLLYVPSENTFGDILKL